MPFRAHIGDPGDQPVRAERFQSALQMRVLATAGLMTGQSFRAILLERGEAVLRTEGEEISLFAPLSAWLPWHEGARLTISAGAKGAHLLLGRNTLERLLQRGAEASQLRFLAERRAVMQLTDRNRGAVNASFEGILAETLAPGPMSSSIVDSYLHVLLVQFYRSQTIGSPSGVEIGGSAAIASQFITLVETNYRNHWNVQRYADALGISRDRLTDICNAVHDRPPGTLIRTRLALEARMILENTTLSLDRIAGALGFGGSAQFNRFFTSQVGSPPGRYRKQHRGAKEKQKPPVSAVYEWP